MSYLGKVARVKVRRDLGGDFYLFRLFRISVFLLTFVTIDKSKRLRALSGNETHYQIKTKNKSKSPLCQRRCPAVSGNETDSLIKTEYKRTKQSDKER